MPSAQINVRLDSDLKHRGDAALAEIDVSPSDAVRALWGAMAEHGKAATALRDALFSPVGQDDAPVDPSTQVDPVLAAGWRTADDFCARLGATTRRQLQDEQRPYEDVYASAMDERYREKGCFA